MSCDSKFYLPQFYLNFFFFASVGRDIADLLPMSLMWYLIECNVMVM